MELRHSLSLAIFWSVLFCEVLCQTQEILFNLKDPESNEVISLGQEDVALVCHVKSIENADITISDAAGVSIAFNLGNGNCLEHTIARLTEADNGNYMCRVRYFDNDSRVYKTITKSLLLNVESGDQQCFRNGTSMQAFGVGDTLLLSCYCTSTINCNWIKTVGGTRLGFSIPVHETVEFDNNKRIIRVIIGPLTSNQTHERYDCYYGSLSTQRCSIGPTYDSRKDFVFNAVDPSTILRECPKAAESDSTNAAVPEITRTQQETVIPTAKLVVKVTEPPADDGLFLYIIIAGGVLLLLIIVVILLICITLTRNRKVKAKAPARKESFKTSSNSNAAYDESDDVPPYRGTMADVSRNGVSSASLVNNDYGGNRAPPDGMGYSDGSQMGDTSQYGVSNAVLVNNENHRGTPGGDVDYAAINTTGKMAEVSQYGVLSAVIMGAGDDDDEWFHRGEVTEYGVPVAFRADGHSDYPDVNRRGEDYDVRELPLRYS